MKTFRLSFLLAAAVAACTLIAAVPIRAVQVVAAAYRFAKAWVHSSVEAVMSAFASPEHLPQPTSLLVQACAYAMRLAKRARPRVTPGWRMCPSA